MRASNVLIIMAATGFAVAPKAAWAQTPVGTAFTYQGQLRDADVPLNGNVDLEFRLFPAAAGGIQVGSTQTKSSVSVANGLFSVDLDFGSTAFNGEDRFLQVAVRNPAGTGSFTTLAPRQRVSAAPYAMFALATAGGVSDGHSLDAADGTPTNVVFVNSAGNVGVGTTAPEAKLHVIGAEEGIRIDGPQVGVPNAAYMTFRDAAGTALGYVGDGSWGDDSMYLASYVRDVHIYTGIGAALSAKADGKVGINMPTPASTLHVNGQSLWLTGGNGGGLPPEAGAGLRLYHDPSRAHIFAWNYSANAPSDVILQEPGGKVGVGTTAPIGGLHVYAEPWTYGGTLTLEGFSHSYISFFPQGAAEGRKAWFGFGGAFTNELTMWNDAGGNINLVTMPGAATRVNVLEIAGADLAEKFPASEKLEPGMVVAIDPENPGKLCLARGAYNRRVAGIVSGANNFSVGAVLGTDSGADDGPPIALSGRVYAWCDASHSAIEPGDFLTTSDMPGHAMKAADPDRSYGAVLGKAMTGLPKGERALVLVLVNLQ